MMLIPAHYVEVKKFTIYKPIKTKTMYNLFEQMANIGKAHGYDILSEQVKELKQVIRDLIEKGDLNDLRFTDQESTDDFINTLNKAKILSL